MRKTTFAAVLAATTAFAFASLDAQAAGFQLKEQSASLQGLSFAGATAKADDLSTIFFNPAGMTRLQGGQAEANVSYISPSSELTLRNATASSGAAGKPALTDGNGGDAGEAAAVPALYALWDVNEKTKFGLAVNTPFGLATKYDDGWAGRYYALDSELTTINIAPSIAYKIDNRWSVGGGLQIQYADARLTKAINSAAIAGNSALADGESILEGDDIALGYTFGVLYELCKNTRYGISYRSAVDHKLRGDLDITGPVEGANVLLTDSKASAELKTPDIVAIGAYHQFHEKWAVLADATWTGWSSFQNLKVVDDAGLTRENVEENWDDTYFVALGTEYYHDDKTTLQFGIAYDQGATDAEHRTFRIPDSDRYWVSAGIQHKFDEDKSFSLGYSRIFTGDVKISEDTDPTNSGIVSGSYEDNSVDILAANFRWKF